MDSGAQPVAEEILPGPLIQGSAASLMPGPQLENICRNLKISVAAAAIGCDVAARFLAQMLMWRNW